MYNIRRQFRVDDSIDMLRQMLLQMTRESCCLPGAQGQFSAQLLVQTS